MVDFEFGGFSLNCQFATLKTLPKFCAIQYVLLIILLAAESGGYILLVEWGEGLVSEAATSQDITNLYPDVVNDVKWQQIWA